MSKKTSKKAPTRVVSREDIQAKMNEINVAIDDLKEDSKNGIKTMAIVGVLIVASIAYFGGHRKAARPKTLLKIIKTK